MSQVCFEFAAISQLLRFHYGTPITKMKKIIRLVCILVYTNISKFVSAHELEDAASFTGDELDRLLEDPPGCIQLAMRPIFEQCVLNGIHAVDPKDRRSLAIEMSVCEFESAGVEYPAECSTTEKDYDTCIWKLGLVPQYWTTFSGNYRDIGLFCEGVSRNNEKEQLVLLYLNITKVFAGFRDAFYESYSRSQEMKDEMEEGFSRWSADFDIAKDQHKEFFEFVEKQQEHIKLELMKNQEVIFESHDKQELRFSSYSNHIVDVMDSITVDLDIILAKLADDGIIEDMENQKSKSLNIMKSYSEDAELTLSRIVSELERVGIIQKNDVSIVENLNSGLVDTTNKVSKLNKDFEDLGSHFQHTKELIESEVSFLFDNLIGEMETKLSQALENVDDRIEFHFVSQLENLDKSLNETWEAVLTFKQDWQIFTLIFEKLENIPKRILHFVTSGIYKANELLTQISYFWSTILNIPVSLLSNILRYTLAASWIAILFILISLRYGFTKLFLLVIMVLLVIFLNTHRW